MCGSVYPVDYANVRSVYNVFIELCAVGTHIPLVVRSLSLRIGALPQGRGYVK